jgi:hypothetical protein
MLSLPADTAMKNEVYFADNSPQFVGSFASQDTDWNCYIVVYDIVRLVFSPGHLCIVGCLVDYLYVRTDWFDGFDMFGDFNYFDFLCGLDFSLVVVLVTHFMLGEWLLFVSRKPCHHF